MENSFYVGISRAQVLQSQMDVISNNIANMSTPGYRSQNLVFEQFLGKGQVTDGKDNSDDRLAMVREYGMYKSNAGGEMKSTGNPLDVAIQGKGWFGVQTPNGTEYTRAGDFQLSATGELVTSSGQPVASAGGGAIIVPNGARYVKISENGAVTTDKGQLGQLMVVELPNDQSVEAQGDGLYKVADGAAAPTAAKNSRVVQGFLEGSNVQPIPEMTHMMAVSRAYQSTLSMLSDEHDREKEMIQTLTKTS